MYLISIKTHCLTLHFSVYISLNFASLLLLIADYNIVGFWNHCQIYRQRCIRCALNFLLKRKILSRVRERREAMIDTRACVHRFNFAAFRFWLYDQKRKSWFLWLLTPFFPSYFYKNLLIKKIFFLNHFTQT